MVRELQEVYVPEKLLHREEPMEKIKETFKIFEEEQECINLRVQGMTGTGKSLLVTKVLAQIKTPYDFASGAISNSAFKLLRTLSNTSASNIEAIETKYIRILQQEPKVIVIDEVHLVKDVKVLFEKLNTIFRETQCPVIVITNDMRITDRMREDAKKTLFLQPIKLAPYHREELEEILLDRLKLVSERYPEKPEFPQKAIEKICSIGAREGSARVTLNIANSCMLKKNFSFEFIDEMWQTIQDADWKDFTTDLNASQRHFLKTILELMDNKMIKKVDYIDVIKEMKNVSPSRVSQIIKALKEEMGIIEVESKNFGGRIGKKSYIKFTTDEIRDKIGKTLYSDSTYSLLNS